MGHAIEVCNVQIFVNSSCFACHICWNSQIFNFLHLQKIQDNNDMLSYWLSNASTLLLLLQRTLKASGAAGMAPLRRRSSSATLFGRMSHVKDSFYFSFSVTGKMFNLHFESPFHQEFFILSLSSVSYYSFFRASGELHKESIFPLGMDCLVE